eukprot:TRINITY_DN6810_c0_g1_i1.p1 TRINITY_DN6810_c0_g1~~TRINITY_DN6810_c0_g1_i1.p1  ORF type:complete len:177 (+),score=17.19 TRINITY_DN6810_c0_g1_i1:130-660(+)
MEGTKSVSQGDIGKILEGMSPSQMYEIMVQMKGLNQISPQKVHNLLTNNPVFAYAMLRTQLVLGMVPLEIASQLNVVQTPAVPVQPIIPPASQQVRPTNIQPVYPVGYVNPAQHTAVTTSPPQQFPYQPQVDEAQSQLIEQLMSLTPDQIDKLSPAEREQVLQLRQALMQMNFVPR